MGRRFPGFLMAVGLWCMAAAVPAQDVIWQRGVQGSVDGNQLAMYHGGADYTKPAFVDIDDDGDGDLFVGEHDGFLNYFMNQGGNPAQWTCVSTGVDCVDVDKQCAPAFWDCDLDGDYDMFLGNEHGRLWFYRNTGSPAAPLWTLEDSTYGLIDVGYHSVPSFHDLDGDDLADLLIGNNSGNFAFYHNSGTPGNPAFTLVTQHYQNINQFMKSTQCIGDVNNDGLPDLFVSGLQGGIFYYRNNGPPQSPTYTNMGIVASVPHNGAPTLWDLDGDGDLDLITGQSDGNLMVWTNSGTPQSPRWQFTQDYYAYFEIGYYSRMAIGDLNGDDLSDILMARGIPGLHYLQNVGTTDSAAWQLVSHNYGGINLPGVESPAFCDLNNDGDLDLVVGCANGSLTYYQNTGTPQIAAWANGVSNYAAVNVNGWSSPSFADIDGDGDQDMFVGSEAGTIRYLRRDGPPTSPVWADLGVVPGVDAGSHSVPSFMDIDGDADLDMLVGCGSNAGNLYFYRNTGSQYWPMWVAVTPIYQNWDFGDHSAPAVVDLNGDDRLDLLIGCTSGGLYHMINVDNTHNVNVYMTPLGAPIVVPDTGGWFNYNITLINNSVVPETFQSWIMVMLPNGAAYGPVLGPVTMTLQPGANYSRYRTQEVPGSAPPGVYAYRAFTGEYPEKWDSTSFNFTKLGINLQGSGWGDWTCAGEPFPGEQPVAAFIPSGLDLRILPNPFNAATAITFKLDANGWVSLKVYDAAGRLVATLSDGWRLAGTHQATFDGSNLASGVYLYSLTAGQQNSTGKMVLLK
jgi:hypothetical protein